MWYLAILQIGRPNGRDDTQTASCEAISRQAAVAMTELHDGVSSFPYQRISCVI